MKKATTKTAVRARTAPAPTPAATVTTTTVADDKFRKKYEKEKKKRKKAEAGASTTSTSSTPAATSFWTTGNVVLIIAVALLIAGSINYAVNRGEKMTDIIASPQYEEIQRELDEAKAAAAEAQAETDRISAEADRERQEAETKRLADEKAKAEADRLAEIERKAEERDAALRQEMLDAIAALAKVEAPTPTSTTVAEPVATESTSPSLEHRFREMQLANGQAGVAEGTPGVHWAGDMNGVRIPLVRSPKDGRWSILTGEGTALPEATPEVGRSWARIIDPATAPTVTSPDGTNVETRGAVTDGVNVYGTLPTPAS